MTNKRRGATSRREFLKIAGYAVALVPLANGVRAAAEPADMPKLDEQDGAAVQFGYLHDATKVDPEKFPRSVEVDGVRPLCSNCVLFQAKGDEEWAGCPIFPGKLVNANGWCNAWAPKS